MKKLLLVGALALSTMFASAQGLEGKWFVGGQFGYNHTKEEIKNSKFELKKDTYTILPTVGTFISPDVAVGAALGYSGSKNGDVKTNAITVMPLARKYWNISGGLFFFGQAALPVSFGDTKGILDESGKELDKIKNFGIGVELAPGLDYIINEKFSIETSFTVLSVGYKNRKQGDWKSNDFGFNVNENGGSKIGELRVGFKMIF